MFPDILSRLLLGEPRPGSRRFAGQGRAEAPAVAVDHQVSPKSRITRLQKAGTCSKNSMPVFSGKMYSK